MGKLLSPFFRFLKCTIVCNDFQFEPTTLSYMVYCVCVCVCMVQKQECKFAEPRARFYLGEIVLALNYLHGFNIIFRYIYTIHHIFKKKLKLASITA